MADTAVAADTNNPSQEGPAVPNVDRAPVVEAKTPEQIAAEAKAAEKPEGEQEAPPADTPQIGDEKPEDRAPLGTTVAEDGTVAYEATGYAGLDMALDFIGKLGIGMDHPAMLATKTGDFSLMEAHLASLGDKATGYDKFIALAKDAFTQHSEKTTAKATAINGAIKGVLGDSQATVLEWASKNASDAERAEINTMLAAGPVQARAAANLLLGAYQKAGGTVIEPASATNGNPGNGSAPSQSNGPLTNKAFATEVGKLHRQYGAAYIKSPEYRALAARLG